MKRMLQIDPVKRISAEDALKHDFFKSFDSKDNFEVDVSNINNAKK